MRVQEFLLKGVAFGSSQPLFLAIHILYIFTDNSCKLLKDY